MIEIVLIFLGFAAFLHYIDKPQDPPDPLGLKEIFKKRD